MSVQRWMLAIAVAAVMASPAAAQSGSRVAVGAAVAGFLPAGQDLDRSGKIVPVVRVRREGWAPALGFHWFDARLVMNDRATGETLSVRPVMAGVSYTVMRRRWTASAALVGGYAFNSVGSRSDGSVAPGTTRVDDSLVVTPRGDLAFDLSRRFGLVATGGYIVTRPNVTVRGAAGDERARWTADSLVLQVGLVVGIF